MKKVPTLFERDWSGDRSRVVDIIHPGCEWVFTGEGMATRKLDGTCCLIRDGKFYKRRELRPGDRNEPTGFELVENDEQTGKIVGWVPVGDGPEDRWHREAFASLEVKRDGTYELVGPKIQGNPERATAHALIPHGPIIVEDVPHTFEGLRNWLATQDIEGVVFHHPDGRMAKIKLRDFGLKRAALSTTRRAP